MVIEGASPAADDDEGLGTKEVQGEGGSEAPARAEAEIPSGSTADGITGENDRPERRELVLANECRLHPGSSRDTKGVVFLFFWREV